MKVTEVGKYQYLATTEIRDNLVSTIQVSVTHSQMKILLSSKTALYMNLIGRISKLVSWLYYLKAWHIIRLFIYFNHSVMLKQTK